MSNNAAYQGKADRPGLLITRPADSANAFAELVRASLNSDLDSVISPILAISHKPLTLDLSAYPTLLFTSAHAVRALAKATTQRSFDCYSVGEATQACAVAEGFETREGGGTAAALAQRIINDEPRAPCLYVRGAHVSCDLAKHLNSGGIETHEAVIYDQQEAQLSPQATELLSSGRPVILPLFSPRSARLFFDRYTSKGPLDVVAMSQNVASEVPADRVRSLRVAAHPTAEAMLEEIAVLLQSTNQLEGRLSPK